MTAVAAPRCAPAPSLSRLFAIELRKTIDTRAGFWLLVSTALAAIAVAAITLAAGDGAARWDVAASGLAAAIPFIVMWMLAGAALGLLVMRSAPAIVLSFVIPTGIVGLTHAIPAADNVLRWIDLGTTSGELDAPHPAISAQDWAHIGTGVVAWVLVPLAIGFVRLRRREVASA